MKRKLDQKEAVRLYMGNWTVSEIAEHFDVDRSRVYHALRGVEMRDDRLRKNRSRPTHCRRRLHEFTEENTRVDSAGGWHCRQCERDYAAIRHYAK